MWWNVSPVDRYVKWSEDNPSRFKYIIYWLQIVTIHDCEVLKPGATVGTAWGKPVPVTTQTNRSEVEDIPLVAPTQSGSGQTMTIDEATVASLNLFPESMDKKGLRRDAQTLFTLLNHCRTPVGQRMLSEWIRRPLMDMQTIRKFVSPQNYDSRRILL